MPDYAHRYTDKEIAALEKEVRAVYKQASEEAEAKLKDYFRRFEIKDEKWAQMVADGERTAAEYAEWRKGQIIVGERWKALSEKLALEYHNANVTARDIALGHRAAVYAENFNFATYGVEMGIKADTAFTIYNKEAVERILRDSPELLPPPGKTMQKTLRENPDLAWQEGQIQSVTMQAIAQGESIPNMSKRIARTMGEINHGATIRYARTALNGAQNAARIDAFHRAEELGIEVKQRWSATLDDRTRYEHRQLDGQERKVGEPFKVGEYEIMFPGDTSAAPEMFWNCRCALQGYTKGWVHREHRSLKATGHETYEDWKNDHKSRSRPITYQEDIGNAMKWKYIHEDYKGK